MSETPRTKRANAKTSDRATANSSSESHLNQSGVAPGAAEPTDTHPTAPTEAAANRTPYGSPWVSPIPFGIGAALGQFYSVFAPVLAGFAMGLVGLVVASRPAFVAPDLVLWLATVAVGALLFAMQVGMWAQQHWVEPGSYLGWYPLAKRDRRAQQLARSNQVADMSAWDWYRVRAGRFYRLGLTAFISACVFATLPPDVPRLIPSIPFGGYVPAATGAIWLVLELCWIVDRPRFIVRRLFGPAPIGDARLAPGFQDDALA